ncbi:hypothetical protein JCM11491_002495 [Sporobolomyces phaffii]
MHAAAGRPSQSYTPTTNRMPYAPPGQARPPRAGGGGGGPKGPSQRSKLRDRWTNLLAGPAFLEPGPSNRLVLSLRSCVASEVDFALERIIQVSSIDPDLLRFNELPGLLDGLLSLIRDYLDRRIYDRDGAGRGAAFIPSEGRETLRRRANEAGVILRNLAFEKKSFEPLLESKRLRKLIVTVLEEGEIEGPEGEETTELRLYLLELVEIIGEHLPLAIPGHAIAVSDDNADENRPAPKPEPLDAPSVRLFPLLVALTRSPDRALVLSAFRCLTVLSLNEKSDPVFALLTYEKLPPVPKPHPHPVETAIRLLVLSDVELSAVVLDFLYQHTLLPSNAAYFCTRPDLLDILRVVCSKFEIGAKAEYVETRVLETSSEAASWYKANYADHIEGNLVTGRAKANGKRALTTATGELLLSEREINEIVGLEEPQRAVDWMHRMYEIDPDSDITQVSLWTAYKTQFEQICASPSVPVMLAAQEVIRLSSQAFPSAVPTIVDDADGRKFIIKGLKTRKRETLEGECGWEGCPVPQGHDAPLTFHQHVYNTHLAVPSPPTQCRWTNCRYSIATTSTDPAVQLASISLHVRTHLPALASTTSTGSVPPPPEAPIDLPVAIVHHTRYHAQKDEHHDATGPSFLACLILRNLTRAAKLAVEATTAATSANGPTSPTAAAVPSRGGGGGRVSVASGTAAIGRLAEGEQSIFEAFALAEEGASGGGGGGAFRRGGASGVLQAVEKVDWSIARPAVEKLARVHDEVVLRTALSNVVLGKYLVEVVVTIEGILKAERERAKIAAAQEEHGEGVKMEE